MLKPELQEAVHRYLRGEMTDREEAEFEALSLDRPDILEELELSSLMKAGLELDERASRAALPASDASRRSLARIEFGLAATLALLIGVGVAQKTGPVPTIDLVQQRAITVAQPNYPVPADSYKVRFRIAVNDDSAAYTVRLRGGPDQALLMERTQLKPDEYGDVTVVIARDKLNLRPLKIVTLNQSSNEAREFVFEVYSEQQP